MRVLLLGSYVMCLMYDDQVMFAMVCSVVFFFVVLSTLSPLIEFGVVFCR